MRSLLALFFITIFASANIGQHDHLGPCGTPTYKSQWLKKYQKNPEAYYSERNEIIYVPLAINLVGEDNGTKVFTDLGLQLALCTLNDDFEQSNIRFYLGREPKVILDSRYAEHSTVLQGAQMMELYDDEDMINVYFMSDPAGNCGYNLPSAGMCVSTSCAAADDHTWAHEMGHQLSIPHPFLGWEGGVSYDGSVGHDFNDPAPDFVLYDYTYFKDTLILDTLIIDTAYVERMDGSNCSFAADGFCDTKPDYLASRWACNPDSTSPTEQTDPEGVKFISDGTLIMSYALDNCSARFSNDQSLAMRANLKDEKPNVLGGEDPQEPVAATSVTINYPLDEDVFPEDIEISWEPIEDATKYLIQLSTFSGFQIPIFDTIVSTNNVVIPELQFPSSKHYYRLKAFNDYNFCAEWLEGQGTFTPNMSVNVDDETTAYWQIRPTRVTDGSAEIYVDVTSATKAVSVNIYSTTGQILQQHKIENRGIIQLDNLSSGLYLIQMSDGQSQKVEKLIVD